MTSSSTMIAAYAALLILVLLTPYMTSFFEPRAGQSETFGLLICATLLAGAIVLTAARNAGLPLLGAFLVIPLAGRGIRSIFAGITAVLLFATVTWWTRSLELSSVPMAFFVVLALAAGFLPRWKSERRGKWKPGLLHLMLLCLIIGLIAGLLTAPFESRQAIYHAWHHWGAYIAPAEAWRGGGVPYRDFPVQYGLGPTTLLMTTCGQDCWRAMYWIAITANALYFATLAGSASILTVRSSRGVKWLALLAMFCACFIWTGFPVSFAGPSMTPSVGGLRFLPISALLFHILVAEHRKLPRNWVGHSIWILDLFWSPEAAYFGTVIWWPYLAMRDAAAAQSGRAAMTALLSGALRGVIALAVAVGAVLLMLWFLSAQAITAADFFAYVQHPPGALPINPVGTVWTALAAILLALYLLAQHGMSADARDCYACALGFMAAGTYYLSRSHDNNVLNLFPLLILVLLSTLDRAEKSNRPFINSFIHTLLAAMIAFVATFNFGPWYEGATSVGSFALGPSRLLARFTPRWNDTPPVFVPDAAAGLEYLRARNAGQVVLLDRHKGLPRSTGSAWTGVNNVANFAPLPPSMIAGYIKRGAAAYRRPGWILADPEYRWWVEAFKSAYDIREERSFGTYTAYYMVPR